MEVCSDGGGEFFNNKFSAYLKERHINHIVLEPYHSQHNRRVERANRTVMESTHAILSKGQIPKSYLHEVVSSCCMLLNQIPKEKGMESLWRRMHGKDLLEGYLRPVGSNLTY